MSLARAPLAGWLGLAALAALGWREAIGFAASSGSALDVEHIFFEAAENPPWLISAVALALLAARRADLRAAIGAPVPALRAAPLLAPGLALLAWARFVSAPELALLGALAMAIGAAYAACGGRFARLLSVPAALLAFAVPLPGALVNQVVYPLQIWTASYAFRVVSWLQVPAIQLADVIHTPTHNFLVIEGCSGLGSMEVLALLALAWAWQTRAPLGRGLLLVLAAPAIAFAVNGLRVVSLVLFHDSSLWSNHTFQGIVAFAVGSLAIALLDLVLSRGKAAAETPAAPAATAARGPLRPSRALALWLGAAALASLLPRYDAPPIAVHGDLLPESLDDWTSSELEIDRLFLGSVRLERGTQRRYERAAGSIRGGESVAVLAAEDGWRSGATSLRSPKFELPGRGWRAESRGPVDLPGRLTAQQVVASSEGRSVLSYTLYFGIGSPARETLRALLALDRSPFRRQERGLAVRLSAEVAPGPGGSRLAERRLREVLQRLRPGLEARVPR